MHLLSVIFVIDSCAESFDQWAHYEMLDFSFQVREVFDRVEDELHEFACRSFNDLRAEVEVLVQRLYGLAHDVTESCHYEGMNVFVATEARVNFGVSNQPLTLLELRQDILGAISGDHILTE